MPLINLVIVLIVVGVLLWLVNAYIPMDGKIKKILNLEYRRRHRGRTLAVAGVWSFRLVQRHSGRPLTPADCSN